VNIIYSQKYNEHMYGVMEGKSDSIIIYLTHILGTPLFNLEIAAYKADGRNDVISKWTSTQLGTVTRIKDLEDAVRLYPYSPELYYNLSLLYSANGDKTKAKENLKKAQQIDPSIE